MTTDRHVLERHTERHPDHEVDFVSMSWGERAECAECRATLVVWNDEGDLIWQRGDLRRDLSYLLGDRDYPEAR